MQAPLWSVFAGWLILIALMVVAVVTLRMAERWAFTRQRGQTRIQCFNCREHFDQSQIVWRHNLPVCRDGCERA